MIGYKALCIFCKKHFQIVEGTAKYRHYKQHLKGKQSCYDCDHKIEGEAKKMLIGKLL